MPRKSSRRDFLRGQSAADAAADLAAGALGEHSAGSPSAAQAYLVQIGRRAMACQFEVIFNAGQYDEATAAALRALDRVERLEAQLSVFRPQSELSRLNRTAADGPVAVEPRLFGLLELALGISAETAGAFDLTASPLWRVWGFARRAGSIPADDVLEQGRQCVGWHLVELDRENLTVRFLRPGVELNLGSIGKGYALDRAADELALAAIGDYLFHGGQSSILARGSRRDLAAADDEAVKAEDARSCDTAAAAPAGWSVGVPHPLRPTTRLGEIRLRNRALGTSSSAAQYFHHQGKRYGHILDPRSGRPADGVLSATVLAPTATLADALATAFYVLGAEASLDYCRTHPEIATVLVVPADGPERYEVLTAGLEEAEFVRA